LGMKCPKCKTENPLVARFCLRCGTRLVQVCAKCGTELPPEATFCLACGVRVHVSSTEPGEKAVAPDAVAERLQRLVPRELAERLLSARGEVRPERRMVTILFSDVKGSTTMAEQLDPEDVMEIMDGAFDVLIEPIVRYEGTVVRLMGDAVVAFFGAPIAHEDDPERACRAALEITAEARGYAEELERERGVRGFPGYGRFGVARECRGVRPALACPTIWSRPASFWRKRDIQVTAACRLFSRFCPAVMAEGPLSPTTLNLSGSRNWASTSGASTRRPRSIGAMCGKSDPIYQGWVGPPTIPIPTTF
jgi:ribosomal protein L40E